eukprot:m.27857 g.27857  ORF g.27857 m.27857 type:complete len:151 (-) comp8984_c0_seq2:425-877(-)
MKQVSDEVLEDTLDRSYKAAFEGGAWGLGIGLVGHFALNQFCKSSGLPSSSAVLQLCSNCTAFFLLVFFLAHAHAQSIMVGIAGWYRRLTPQLKVFAVSTPLICGMMIAGELKLIDIEKEQHKAIHQQNMQRILEERKRNAEAKASAESS